MKKVLSILWLMSIALFAVSQNCIQCDTNSIATGNYASVMGISNLATNDGAFAGGFESEANGVHSFAFGIQAKTYEHHTFALGGFSIAEAAYSFTIGNKCKTSGFGSFVIGSGFSTTEILENPYSNSLMIGFQSTKPTLFVKGGGAIDGTGSIGIGDVTDPQAKLHIKADEDEPAVLLIEPYAFTGGESVKLRLGNMDHGVSAGYGRLYFNTGSFYVFNSNDSKVGIGTPSPTEKLEVDGNIKITSGNLFIDNNEGGIVLKSPDGQCWKVTVNNNGELITTLTDCNLITENEDEVQIDTQHFKIYPNPTKNKIKIESSWDSYQMVKVADMNGALVIAEEIHSGINELSLKNLSKGYYVVTIIDEGNKTLFSEKIIKN